MYYQYLGGEQFYRPALPCSSTELVEFRKRIGEEGMTLILQESININRQNNDDKFGKTISIETTVKEKNITYPTDDKLHKKIIDKCVKIAEKEDVVLTQTYAKELKKLSHQQRFKNRKNGFKIAQKANKRVKTIAGDMDRNLTPSAIAAHETDIELYKKVLAQQRGDSHKIYSLHEPEENVMPKAKSIKSLSLEVKLPLPFVKQQA